MPDEDTGEQASPEQKPAQADADKVLDLIAQKDRQIDELTETLKRLQAEFENFKKRSEREWSERTMLAGERVITELLPVLDTFDKALQSTKDGVDAKALRSGLTGIHKQLMTALQREGLREIKTDGKLDPFKHEALMREEDEDGDDGKILEVFQKGYMLGPRVIRTAKVKVSKKKEPELQQQAEDDIHDAQESEQSEVRDDDKER
jgi:molecular chaperone GrpE